MKTLGLVRIAASTLLLGTTALITTGAASPPSETAMARTAAKAAQQAAKAMAKKDYAAAVTASEAAVAASARNADYRLLLGQAYLAAGRFASAETSFSDALTLSPDMGKAALNLALVEVARGKADAARATLADYRDRIPATDWGLAAALAGDTESAVRVLEDVVRSPNADAKARQNLALAYALAGKWMNARVMAVQDLTPGDADARIVSWMSFVHPKAASDQVASLLGVTPVEDAGQPSRLALATPSPAPVETADAVPVETAPAPVQTAAPEPVPVVQAVAQPVVDMPPPAFEVAAPVQVRHSGQFAAPHEVVQPLPVIRAESRPIRQPLPRQAIVRTPHAGPVHSAADFTARTVGSGRFVVQLGAFASAANAESAWKRASSRFQLTSFEPGNAQFRIRSASLIRLSVGGFATRAAASKLCARIQARGGQCFVRTASGDAPAQWVQRGMPRFASR